MRDFFIRSLEVLINIVVVVAAIAIVAAAGLAAFTDGTLIQGMPAGGGPLTGLLILVGGFLYLVFVAGFMFLGLGIYQNTRRMAEAMDRQGGKP